MVQSVCTTHRLPGRIRLAVPFLRHQPYLGPALEDVLLGVQGVLSARTRSSTGSLLVVFDHTHITEDALGRCVANAFVPGQGPPPRRPRAQPPKPSRLPGPELAAVGLALAVAGEGLPVPRVAAEWARVTSGVLSVAAAYPSLRRGGGSLVRGRLTSELLIPVASFLLLVARGSTIALLVLWLNATARAVEANAYARCRAVLAKGSASQPPPSSTRPVDAASVRLAQLAWVCATAVLLLRRGPTVALTALVAGSPKVLGTCGPLARSGAVEAAEAMGVLFRRPETVAALGRVDGVAVELPTLGQGGDPEVEEVTTYGRDYPEERVLRLAVQALVQVAPEGFASPERHLKTVGSARSRRRPKVQVVVGMGVTMTVDRETLIVGCRALLTERGVPTSHADDDVARMEAMGVDVVAVAHGGRLVGLVGLRTPPNHQAVWAVQNLRSMGIIDLRGYSVGPVGYPAALARRLGVTAPFEPHAHHAPLEQLALVASKAIPSALLAGTDASEWPLVLAPRGSEASVEADVLLPSVGLSALPNLLELAHLSGEVTAQNRAISLTSSLVGLALTLAGRLGLAQASLLVNLTGLAIVANSRRTRGFSPRPLRPVVRVVGGTGFDLAPVSACRELDILEGVRPWHAMSPSELEGHLATCTNLGLSDDEALRRIAYFGPNSLDEARPTSFLNLFLTQFKDAMVLTLMGASGVALLVGGTRDALIILGTLCVNGLFGASQEYRTDRSVAALRELAAPTAKVIRDGRGLVVPATELVPGDILLLEAGYRVPADGRIVQAQGLEAEESSLTGESSPATKHAGEMQGEGLAPGDRTNMVFMGTSITRGKAKVIVLRTGMHTEMGAILTMLAESRAGVTPLQHAMDRLGKSMLTASLAIAGGVLVIGLLRGHPAFMMFMTAVSLAVAAIPEGLPVTVTLALTSGVRRMAKQRAVARRLSSIETLGAVSVICSDKTGTLTMNQMTVKAAYEGGALWEASDSAAGREVWCREPQLPHSLGLRAVSADVWPPRGIIGLLGLARACCDGTVQSGCRERTDPIDVAIQRAFAVAVEASAGRVAGVPQDDYDGYDCLAEVPFDAERKRVTVVVRAPNGPAMVITKGALDAILPLCTECSRDGASLPLTGKALMGVEMAAERMAADALRVIGVATRQLDDWTEGTLQPLEEGMCLVGLIGLLDPPRPEASRSIALCRQAGTRVVMITGDHPKTAVSVGSRLGLCDADCLVLTGAQLDSLSDVELDELLPHASIFARVAPRHKLRIVRAFHRAGHVVAMTGDGVNDAPAVKEADVGVSMGSGTDATKEASDLVVTDDNFATLVVAIREGRAVRQNIRNAVGYNMGGNTGEVIAMLLGTLAGLPLPLLPVQLLLLNVLSDGPPVFVLATARPDDGALRGRPTDPREGLFARGLTFQVVVRGVLIGLSTFLLYAWAMRTGSMVRARSMALASLVVSQWAQVPDWEFGGCPELRHGRRRDPNLVACVAVGAIALPFFFHVPLLAGIFGTVPLAFSDWLAVSAMSLGVGGLSKAVCRGHAEEGVAEGNRSVLDTPFRLEMPPCPAGHHALVEAPSRLPVALA